MCARILTCLQLSRVAPAPHGLLATMRDFHEEFEYQYLPHTRTRPHVPLPGLPWTHRFSARLAILRSDNTVSTSIHIAFDSYKWAVAHNITTRSWNTARRSHVIHDHGSDCRGLYSIIGGKLTTYRSLAEETVNTIFKALRRPVPRCTTAKTLFPGARVNEFDAYAHRLAETTDLPPSTIDRLVEIYGSRAGDILDLCGEDPALAEVFDPDTGAIAAELVFTFKTEFCRTLTDCLIRRVMVGLNGTCGRKTLERATDILATRLGWDKDRQTREISNYKTYIRRFDVPGQSARHNEVAAK